jgi:ornithine carbamoyltransferase
MVAELQGRTSGPRPTRHVLDVDDLGADVARTLACYHSVMCARLVDHASLVRMTAALDVAGVDVPVVNLLSDRGDANDVWRSPAMAASMCGITTRVAVPEGYGPSPEDVELVGSFGGGLLVTTYPAEAVAGVDAIYTDVWTSMGQETEARARLTAFAGYIVDEGLVCGAADHAVVLHCLPAHRGEEISAAVVDGPRSAVWRQAANRMHAMRGLLAWVRGVGTGPGVRSR